MTPGAYNCTPRLPETRLEADVGSDGDTQVVKRAIMEVDFVPDFQTQSDPTDEPFDASTRVKGQMSAGATHAIDGIRERRPGNRSSGGLIEVDEAHFAGHEYADWA